MFLVIHVYVSACVSVFYVCVCVFVYLYRCVCVSVYSCMCVCVCVFVYVCCGKPQRDPGLRCTQFRRLETRGGWTALACILLPKNNTFKQNKIILQGACSSRVTAHDHAWSNSQYFGNRPVVAGWHLHSFSISRCTFLLRGLLNKLQLCGLFADRETEKHFKGQAHGLTMRGLRLLSLVLGGLSRHSLSGDATVFNYKDNINESRCCAVTWPWTWYWTGRTHSIATP